MKFSTQVALAKISLGNITATSVSMYNKDGGLVVSTPTSGNHTFTDNVYFALTQGTYNNIFLQIDTATDVYTKKMNDIQLVANKMYSIDNNVDSGIGYSVIDNTLYVYGNGDIPDKYFKKVNSVSGLDSFGPAVVILDGITSIGDNAFTNRANCGNIKFKVLAVTPPTLSSSALGQTQDPVAIYVPSTLVNVYKSATGWSDYSTKIQAIQ